MVRSKRRKGKKRKMRKKNKRFYSDPLGSKAEKIFNKL
jgi:hypothetical protein